MMTSRKHEHDYDPQTGSCYCGNVWSGDESPVSRAGKCDWTLSKPLTNQILADDLRRGSLATSIYGIDIPEDGADRVHFGAVIVFGNDERAAQIVTEHNQHATLSEQRQWLIETLRDEITALGTWKKAKGLPIDVADGIAISLSKLAATIATIEQEGEAG